MHVLIIGAGALGLLVGSFVAKGGGAVTYLTRTQTQADLLNESGVVLASQVDEPGSFTVQAYPFFQAGHYAPEHSSTKIPYSGNDFEQVDLAIITTKQHHLDTILPWINHYISTDKPLLFLLNGLGHQEKVSQQLEHPNVFYGITQMGAFKTAANTVQQRGQGRTIIGPDHSYEGEVSEATVRQKGQQGIVSFMNGWRDQGLEICYSNDIESELWKKCIVNACINPLTALFRVQNGALIEEVELHRLMRELYLEAAQLIAVVKPNQKDAILDRHHLWPEIERICKLTAENYSSMLQDMQQGRPTEIDSITGYLLTQAKSGGVSMPNHQFLYRAIHFMQKQTVMS